MAKKSAAKKSSSPARKPTPAPRKGKAAEAAGGGWVMQLHQLMAFMVEKDVVEVEIEEAGARWRVRRAEPHAVAFAAPQGMPMALPMGGPAGAGAPALDAARAAAAPAEPAGEVFKSPMVGTFYRAPSPEAEAFCKPGDRVVADRTICIIEAMKVMNEIKAEREFEIVDILVKNGESVEFGQPLFLIR